MHFMMKQGYVLTRHVFSTSREWLTTSEESLRAIVRASFSFPVALSVNIVEKSSMRTVNRSPRGNKTHRDQFKKSTWHMRRVITSPSSTNPSSRREGRDPGLLERAGVSKRERKSLS